jgi:hypothetical protein
MTETLRTLAIRFLAFFTRGRLEEPSYGLVFLIGNYLGTLASNFMAILSVS